jgi:hypothetical protein
MFERKSRVDFNAPESLVEEADAVAALLDTSRTSLLIDALREQIDETTDDEGFRRRLADAYYDGRVDFETVETVVGREEALRLRLLRESLDRDPPVPEPGEADRPTAEAFYDGDPPEWTPTESSERDELPGSDE